MLGCWRAEISAYLRHHGLESVEDASNQDWRYYRNRLRGEALPYLEELNPGVRARFHQTAALLRDDDAVVEAAAETAWHTCLEVREPTGLALNAPRLQALPVALQRRLLRRAAAGLRPGLRDIDYAAIQRGLEFLAAPARSRRTEWIAGLALEMEMDGERLWVIDGRAAEVGGWPQLSPDAALPLSVPGETPLPGGWLLRAELLAAGPGLLAAAQANPDPFQAWLDLEALPPPLAVRARRPGDRFRPLGMHGHSIKLSDFMINAGLPRRRRSGWPLVLAGAEIAWVPGFRPAQAYAVTAETRRAIHLHLLAAPPE
jgi:tRNA(Ile)-lysidine synthase